MPLSGNKGPPPAGPSIQEAIAEARTRELDFPAKERAAYVRAMVARVKELKRAGRSIAEIETQLPEFKRDHPYLFEMVTEHDDFDEGSLQTMLTMLERMGNGQLNHHQATVIVGERLASRYFQGGAR
jgi:hypothetical protein